MEKIASISVLNFFEKLAHSRQQARVLYPLNAIILIALCAVIGGAHGFVALAQSRKAKIGFLRKCVHLFIKTGVPGHYTFDAVLPNLTRSSSETFLYHALYRCI